MAQRKVYRNGKVHIKANLCATCIFRPGNLMHLNPGRVEDMVRQATQKNSCISCHETLGGLQAVCRGFYEKHATGPLQIASRLGLVQWQP